MWFGAIVGLWTATSFIETIRDILRRAYGVKYSASFWQYRLISMAVILAAVVLLLIAFGLTLFLTSAHHYVVAKLPFSEGLARNLGLYRIAPGVTLFATFYIMFLTLTPSRYRKIDCRKWPGALLVTIWWLLTVELLPRRDRPVRRLCADLWQPCRGDGRACCSSSSSGLAWWRGPNSTPRWPIRATSR